jgi:hypothetical protein
MMGTAIRLEANKGENTTEEQWQKLFEHFEDKGYCPERDDEFITMDIISCPFSAANILSHLPDDVSFLKGSGITLYLWFEERDPDETITF